MAQSKFEIFKGKDDQYYFHLKAGNGEIILASEGYTTKAHCEEGIQSVINNSKDASSFEKLDAQDGRFYFNLKASNGQVVGTSQMYSSISARDHGIESVRENAPEADILEK